MTEPTGTDEQALAHGARLLAVDPVAALAQPDEILRVAPTYPEASRLGMTPAQAIRAAIIDAARTLGRDGEFGAVKVGLAATLIATPGDPLTDVERLRDVRGVIQQGRVGAALRAGAPA